MSIQIDHTPLPPVLGEKVETRPDDWELDVTFVEAGDSVKDLIYMTNDNCGQTCQTACPATCP